MSHLWGGWMDHNLLSVLLSCVLFALGVIGFFLWNWALFVNRSITKIGDKLDLQEKERKERWEELHHKCELHSVEIAKLQGRLEGKSKVFDALGELKEGKL